MKKFYIISGALSILLLIFAGVAVYFYLQFSEIKKNPQKVALAETEALVNRVSKLIVLPEGETPTVATVTDPERLKDQPFFAKAKKGDKVLIYTDAKKAILYDPVANKIMEVAPVNIGTPQQQPAETTP